MTGQLTRKLMQTPLPLPSEEYCRALDELFAQKKGIAGLWEIKMKMMETRMRNIREKFNMPMEA